MNSDEPAAPPGVIFDLDGTLMDTVDDLTNAVNVLLEEVDRPPVSSKSVRGMIGEGLSIFLRRASGINDPEIIAGLVKRYRPLYAARLFENTRLFPGVPLLLDAVAEARMPMGILSNKPHEYTVPLCEVLLRRWPLIQCRGTMDGVPKKPDPTAALALAREMNRPAGNVYFIGDSEVDIQTARSAGMIPIAITWGYGDRDDLIAAEAALTVDTPAQLAKMITSDRRP